MMMNRADSVRARHRIGRPTYCFATLSSKAGSWTWTFPRSLLRGSPRPTSSLRNWALWYPAACCGERHLPQRASRSRSPGCLGFRHTHCSCNRWKRSVDLFIPDLVGPGWFYLPARATFSRAMSLTSAAHIITLASPPRNPFQWMGHTCAVAHQKLGSTSAWFREVTKVDWVVDNL